MNPSPVATTPGWLISARVDGEVLVARSAGGSLSLLLLTGPEGYSPDEIEAWLGELIGVASGAQGAPDGPIPPLLHAALTGLLFSHAELWEASAAHQPCSIAFLASPGALAFGWVGDVGVRVWADDRLLTPAWVRVRDSEAREAHAMSFDPGSSARVELKWTNRSDDGAVRAAEISATWTPSAEAVATDAPSRTTAAGLPGPAAGLPDAAVADEDAPGVPHRGRPGWQFRKWVEEAGSPEVEICDTGPSAPTVAADELNPEAPHPDPADVAPADPSGPGMPEVRNMEAVADTPASPTDPPPEMPALAAPVEPAIAVASNAHDPPARTTGRVPPPIPRHWPAEPRRRVPWGPITMTGALVALLFAAGWLLGGAGRGGSAAALHRAMDASGLGPGHFALAVDSDPQGAWIRVDGRDAGQRTPAALDLPAGPHEVTLELRGLGSASYPVRGARGERVPLRAELQGSLTITSAETGVPVLVAVDAVPRGALPVTVDGLAPGIHKVEFTVAGVGGWEQTAEVRIHEAGEVVAHPLAIAPTGVLRIQATASVDGAPEPVTGARVWVDGERRGATPLTLELPRGPHSVQLQWRGEESEVQLIELPGGNTRYASFEMGAELPAPRVRVSPLPERIPADPPTVVSASLQGVPAGELRELWLHVSTPEGAWRRYPMNLLRSPGSVAGAAVFPAGSFDARGRARWYVSALVAAGDEYFTPIQTVLSATPSPALTR